MVATAICASAISSNTSPAFAASFGVGVVSRPIFCLSSCTGNAFSVGPEVSWGVFAIAWRFVRDGGYTLHIPDIRFAYEIPVGPISVAPLLEFSPMFAFLSGDSSLQLVLRPGVRVYWKPTPLIALFVEPIALDIAIYSKLYEAVSSTSSTDMQIRYNLGFGVAVRF